MFCQKVEEIWSHAIDLYSNEGVQVVVSHPNWAKVTQVSNASMPMGIAKSDVQIFKDFAEEINPKNIFVIGNAFGWSATLISLLFPSSTIDVIDAEIEHDGPGATKIAKKVFSKLDSKINLHIGFSPQDVPIAMNSKCYDMVFLDGFHEKNQVIKDFDAISSFLSKECIVFFHDVRLLKNCQNYEDGVSSIFDRIQQNGFCTYKLEKNERNESGMWFVTSGIEKKESLEYEIIKS